MARGRFRNTGNTIRNYHRDAHLRRYQRYGCLVVDNGIDCRDKRAAEVMKDVLTVLPGKDSSGVEFSLNKLRRWELPEYIKNKVELEWDSTDVQLTLTEHTLDVPSSQAIDQRQTCTSYYCNVGNVRECVSTTEMNIKSAKQGHRDQDHLSKLERRAFKKIKADSRVDCDEVSGLPTFDCHIAYGPKSNGKFYKELATKDFAQTKKNRNDASGCSKRFRTKDLCLDDYDPSTFTHEDYSYSDGEDFPDTSVDGHTTFSLPVTAPLSDFVKPSVKPRRSRKNSKELCGSFVLT